MFFRSFTYTSSHDILFVNSVSDFKSASLTRTSSIYTRSKQTQFPQFSLHVPLRRRIFFDLQHFRYLVFNGQHCARSSPSHLTRYPNISNLLFRVVWFWISGRYKLSIEDFSNRFREYVAPALMTSSTQIATGKFKSKFDNIWMCHSHHHNRTIFTLHWAI